MVESLKEDSRPADQWYWDDWFSSHDVQSCSFAAQGLWINVLGIMFTSEIRGTLTINGRQLDNKAIAKRFGKPLAEIDELMDELEENRVYDRLEDGTVINRRMFSRSKKKEEISKIRAAAGKEGAKARWQSDGKGDGKTKIGKKAKIAAPSPSPSPSPPSFPPPSIKKRENKNSLCLKKISDEDQRLTQLLIDLMLENDPDSSIIRRLTEKRQIRWMDACRKLREIDKRPPELIERIIRFSQEDEFWHKNILSMVKLREKFDQLYLKAKKEKYSGIREWMEDEK